MPELSPPGLLRLGFHLDDRHLSHRPTKRKFVLLGERELCGPRTSHWRWMALRNVTRDCMCTWPTVQPRWRPVKLRLLYGVDRNKWSPRITCSSPLRFRSVSFNPARLGAGTRSGRPAVRRIAQGGALLASQPGNYTNLQTSSQLRGEIFGWDSTRRKKDIELRL